MTPHSQKVGRVVFDHSVNDGYLLLFWWSLISWFSFICSLFHVFLKAALQSFSEVLCLQSIQLHMRSGEYPNSHLRKLGLQALSTAMLSRCFAVSQSPDLHFCPSGLLTCHDNGIIAFSITARLLKNHILWDLSLWSPQRFWLESVRTSLQC